MGLFLRDPNKVKIDGRIFFVGQRVRYSGREYTVSEGYNLPCRYEEMGNLPMAYDGYSHYTDTRPQFLTIIDEYKQKKGGVKRMPRIFKWALYSVLVFSVFRLANPLVDLLIQYLQTLVLKK